MSTKASSCVAVLNPLGLYRNSLEKVCLHSAHLESIHAHIFLEKKGIILAMYTPVTDTCQEMSQWLFLQSECIHQHVRPGEDLPVSRLFMKLCLITSLPPLPKHLQTNSYSSTGVNQRSNEALCNLLIFCNSVAVQQNHAQCNPGPALHRQVRRHMLSGSFVKNTVFMRKQDDNFQSWLSRTLCHIAARLWKK